MMTNCRHFNGYKPCGLSDSCSQECAFFDSFEKTILIVHLGAIGAVVRSTSLLRSIKKKFGKVYITWVTDAPSHQLLKGHPMIDQIVSTEPKELIQLKFRKFHFALVIDKSARAVGIVESLKVEKVFGFKASELNGAILPATSAARELWEIGLNDNLKFYKNLKSEVQLTAEALELPYERELCKYNLPLSSDEESLSSQRREFWKKNPEQPIIGVNTGCSNTLPAKKLSIQNHRDLVRKLLFRGYKNIVLLGGSEDTQRNKQISNGFDISSSPTELGLRDGLVSVSACDIIISGDSLGLHMAISQHKYSVAWFGPTCSQEIELFDRGYKVLTSANCSPCWKKSCGQKTMCYDLVNLEEVVESVIKCEQRWKTDLENQKQIHLDPVRIRNIQHFL